MNEWMVNVFVNDSTDGLVTAALLHFWARGWGSSIHVCFTGDGDSAVQDFLATLGIAKALGCELPKNREIYVLTHCSEETRRLLKRVCDKDHSMLLQHNVGLEIPWNWKGKIVRWLARFYKLLYGREEAVFKLTQLFYRWDVVEWADFS